LYPTQDRRVCQINAAFGHHSDQITIAELVAEVPSNVQDHDLLVEVATFEQLFDRYELRHLLHHRQADSCLPQSLREQLESDLATYASVAGQFPSKLDEWDKYEMW